jgi:hypothetical protein
VSTNEQAAQPGCGVPGNFSKKQQSLTQRRAHNWILTKTVQPAIQHQIHD